MASGEPLLGSVDLWPIDWAPMGWLACNGQLLPIVQYQALYALIGTRFGGDGINNFAIPDLRARVPIGSGNNPGKTTYNLGQTGGNETTVLTTNQLPTHSHTATASVSPKTSEGGRGAVNTPGGNYMGPAPATETIYGPAGTGCMGSSPVTVTISNSGSSAAVSLLQPYLGMNYIIAFQGLWPERP